MNFQQLRSVRETVRRGFNLTEVANALFTSQPGVSRQIRELEEELGVDMTTLVNNTVLTTNFRVSGANVCTEKKTGVVVGLQLSMLAWDI